MPRGGAPVEAESRNPHFGHFGHDPCFRTVVSGPSGVGEDVLMYGAVYQGRNSPEFPSPIGPSSQATDHELSTRC